MKIDQKGDVIQIPGEPSSPEKDLQDDPLLSCLAYLAKLYGRPFSQTAAVNGLPLRNNRLTVDLFTRAAARIGLDAKLVQRKISAVPSIVIPFIVLFEGGDACVVTGRWLGNRRASVVFPELSEKSRSISIKKLEKDSSGYLFYVTPEEEQDQESINSATLSKSGGHWFWSAVRKFWPSWLQVILAAFVINLLALALPLFVMNVYDRVIPNLAIPTLWALTLGVTIALFFDLILKQLRTLVLDQTGNRVDMSIAANLFEHALAVPMKNRPASAGAFASQIREFETVRDFFTSSSIIAVTDLLFIGIFIGVLWLIVGPIAYVALIAVPVVLLATLFIQIPLAKSVRQAQSHASRRHSILIESLIGVETIKSLSAENVMQRRWEEAVSGTARSNSTTKFWSSLALYLTNYVQQAVSVIIIVWGVFLVGEGLITIGALIAANILASRVLAPLGNIALTIARAQHAIAAMRSLNSFMKLQQERPGVIESGSRVLRGEIEFRDVSFLYPGSAKEAIKGVSFKISAGEKVGIIGRVGSGKTTLGKLISGLYTTEIGSVLVDGTDVRHYDPAELRAGVGFLSQDPELFAGTVRENILLGKQNANEDELSRVAHLSGVDVFTKTHPLGLALAIGERGQGLSGGQRQAVALARILIRNPKILFLDEPSGAMDTATENAVIENIGSEALKDRTLVICTHRSSFLDIVDRLLVIDEGRIVADGPKSAVLEALQRNDSQSGKQVSAS